VAALHDVQGNSIQVDARAAGHVDIAAWDSATVAGFTCFKCLTYVRPYWGCKRLVPHS
jgi:hypothetical protein